MKYKLMLVIATVAILTVPSFAAENSAVKTILTLDDAYKLAVESSIDVKTADDNIEIAEDALHDAEVAKDDIEWKYNDAEAYMELIYTEDYYPIIAEHDLVTAKRDKTVLLENLKIEVTDAYVNYSQLIDLLEESKANQLQAETTYQNKEKEYELGLLTETDLKSYEVAMLKAQLAVLNSENNLDQAKIAFNQMIGYSIDTDIKLSTVVDASTEVSYNITLLTNGIETYNQTLLDLKEKIDEQTLKIQLIKDNVLDRKSVTLNGSTSYLYGEASGLVLAEDDLEDLKDDYNEALKDEVMNLKIAYNSLKSSELTVKINALSYDSAVRSFNTAKLQNDLGLITALDFQTAKDSMASAHEAYTSSIYDLYVADLEFKEKIGTYSIE